jgi:hypothetical protein
MWSRVCCFGFLAVNFGCELGGPPSGGGSDTGEIERLALPPESECEDGLDNDEDGLADCEDEDCGEVFYCTWPGAVEHSVILSYEASTLATWAGYRDCEGAMTAVLATTETGACDICDRTFEGTVQLTHDTCPADFGERPATVSYGVVFTSQTERTFYGPTEEGWIVIGSDTDVDGLGVFEFSLNEHIDYEGYNGGELYTTFTFVDHVEN